MRFCIECGKKLSDAAKFCDACGTKVEIRTKKKETTQSVSIKDIAKFMDERQTEKVKDLIESFKEDNDCDRIHVVGEDDFNEFVANFAGVLKSRGCDECVASGLAEHAIALIDNSKTGQGKRGTLITRMGLAVIDKDIPNYEDGEENVGIVPWALFAKFGKPVDDESYCLMDVDEFNESDEVDNDVRENLDYSDAEFLLRFSRTELTEDQVEELVSSLKDAVVCDNADGDEDDDDEADYADEAEDEEEGEEDEEDDYADEEDDDK